MSLHETPYFSTPLDGDSWQNSRDGGKTRGMAGAETLVIDAIRIHIYTSGFNFTFNTLLKLYTGDTEEGRRPLPVFHPKKRRKQTQ